MKKSIMMGLAALLAGGLGAQDLPVPSPRSTVDQRIGLTDFRIDYSRPSARERSIFGDLVPYGEVWRTGANKATTISFSTDVNLGGQGVEAGKYSVFTMPIEGGGWRIMLNVETELWGTGDYNPEKNIVEIEAEGREAEYFDTFTIYFDRIREESANLHLRWAQQNIIIPIEVETRETALSNIKEAIGNAEEDGDAWKVYRNSANYLHSNDIDQERAMDYMGTSVKMNDASWYSHHLYSEILAANKEFKKAVKSAKKAIALGSEEAAESDNDFSYEEMISKNIKKWSEK